MPRLTIDQEIASLAAARDIVLPADYVRFLITKNGGVCRKDQSIALDNGLEAIPNVLFGFVDNKALNLSYWNEELGSDLGPGVILIGNDQGGGLFVLADQGKGCQLFYYDHTYEFPGSSDEGNAYTCDISLPQLLDLVVTPFSA